MSLIAHYPLNGDANDMLGNYNGTASNVTWVDGKLGQAGNFTSSSNINITPISLPSTASFCAWGYMVDSGSGQMLFSTDRANGNGCDLYFSVGVISWNTGDGNGNPFRNNGVNVSYPSLNTWHHYTVVNDMVRNKVILYLNGSYYGEANWRDTIQTNRRFIIGNYNSGTSYAWRGLINDVRVYDHALSPKEIKEITKAKVLHYKFDDPYEEPTTNLWTTPLKVYNNYRVPASLTLTGENFYGQPVERLSMTVDDAHASYLGNFRSSLYSHGVFGGSTTFLANTKYVASIMWRSVNKSDVQFGGTASNIGGWISKGNEYLGNGWNRFSVVRDGTVTDDRTDTVFFSFFSPSLQLNEEVLIDVCAPQIEKEKDHATPFTIGTRQGSIRDCSGFRNDGLSPSFGVKPNSPFGFSYGEFNNTSQSTGTFSLTSDTMTGSVWIKKTGDSTNWRTIFASNGNVHPLIISPSNEVSIFDGRQKKFSYTLSDTDWHNFVVIWKNGSADLYVDGVFNSTVVTSYNVRTQPIRRIGNFDGGYYPAGSIADVQIYATALSASDIKELYELRGSIESNGTFWAEDLSETEVVTSGLKSSGTLEGTELIETGYSPSLIDYSTWKIGDSNAVGFSNNGSTAENGIEINTNPWGDEDIVWAARNNDTGSGADGGFNGSAVPIDRTKTHRFSIWIRRAVSGNGTWYFGCSASNGTVESLSGSPNGNPYFSNGGSVFENEWFLLVGYVYPTGTTTNLYDDAGIYDVQGKKLTSISSFRCGTGTTHLGLRSYLYYSTQPSTVQFFYRPRIDVMDTSAPTLRDILTGSENQPIIHQYGSSGQYENEYSKINTNGKVLASEFNEV